MQNNVHRIYVETLHVTSLRGFGNIIILRVLQFVKHASFLVIIKLLN